MVRPFGLRITVRMRLAALHVGFMSIVVFALRLDCWTVLMTVVPLKTGRQANRYRSGHHGVGTNQHQRPPEAGDLFRLISAGPRPC